MCSAERQRMEKSWANYEMLKYYAHKFHRQNFWIKNERKRNKKIQTKRTNLFSRIFSLKTVCVFRFTHHIPSTFLQYFLLCNHFYHLRESKHFLTVKNFSFHHHSKNECRISKRNQRQFDGIKANKQTIIMLVYYLFIQCSCNKKYIRKRIRVFVCAKISYTNRRKVFTNWHHSVVN